jgi:hypothetical protein
VIADPVRVLMAIRHDGRISIGPCLLQTPLRGRSGWKIWCGLDFPSDCIHELVTSYKEQLANKVHDCGMHWHGVCIRIVAFEPEEVSEKLGDGQRGCNLSKSNKGVGRKRKSVGLQVVM